MNRRKAVFIVAALIVVTGGGMKEIFAKGKMNGSLDVKAKGVIDEFVEKYKPLDLEIRKAWYQYTATGDKKASKRQADLELAIRKLQSDPVRFALLKEFYTDRSQIEDPLLRRQVELLYLGHLENQVSPEKLAKLTDLQREIQEIFNDYRPVVDGKRLTPVDVDHMIQDSTDSKQLEKVWKEQTKVGALLEKKYRELVLLRNQIARDLGYKNYVELSAVTREFDLKELEKFYRDVRRMTEEPFRRLKEEYIDPRLAKRYGVGTQDLRPWHYQNPFFQEAPTAVFGAVDLDTFYEKTDSNRAIQKAEEFYRSMGVDISQIIKRSSLFPKEGKNPHAVAWFLNPLTTDNSVLVMNLPNPPKAPKASEVSTLVHELSHDINFEAILRNARLPYLLRETSMLTEAVAMLFENQTKTGEWFQKFGASEEEAQKAVREVELIDYVDQLIFLRWASTINCFETQFYANPDQDIGDLWWQCRSKHQLLNRPEGWKNPDALAKYHIPNITPLQYSNYAIGRVANVQFADEIAKRIGQDPRTASYWNQRELGTWLMGDFLATGQADRWDDFIRRTTGKPLSLKAWEKFYLKAGLEKRLFRSK